MSYGAIRVIFNSPLKREEALRFSESVINKLPVTLQPNKLYFKSWCYFKPETCSYSLCDGHEFKFKVNGGRPMSI